MSKSDGARFDLILAMAIELSRGHRRQRGCCTGQLLRLMTLGHVGKKQHTKWLSFSSAL